MENQNDNYDINGVILDSTCLLDVYLKINEKKVTSTRSSTSSPQSA